MRNLLLCSLVVLLSCNSRDLKKQSPVNENDSTKSYLLFIGTYTDKEAGEAGKSEGIYVYRMNPETGSLNYVNTSPFTINPSFLDISKDGNFLYSVSETGEDQPGRISAFKISGKDPQLKLINQVSSEGDYPCYIEVDRKGQFILTANYGSGTVALIGIDTNGALKANPSVHRHEGRGLTSRQESAHAHCIMASNDGKFIYSSDLGTDKIFIYKTNDNKLALSSAFETAEGSGPRHLAFHPDKEIVYSINELNGTIDCMHRDTMSGRLERFQTIACVPEGNATEAGSADIHITPSGEFLYATNRGEHNNIAAFRVDRETGGLSLIAIQPVKGKTPRNFAIDPSGKFLLVANQNSDQVVVFRIDQVSGRLTDTGIEEKVPAPVCLKFLPAGVLN